MDKSNRVTLKANRELQRILKDLQLYYGLSTRSPLLAQLVVETTLSIYKNPMPKNLTREQKLAYRRLIKYIDSIRKELKKAQKKFEAAAKRRKNKSR